MRMKFSTFRAATIAFLLCSAIFNLAHAATAPSQIGGSSRNSSDMMAVFERQRKMQEALIWTVHGLRDMDSNKNLRLTKEQAKQILPIFQKWEKDGTIQLKVTEPEQRQSGTTTSAPGNSATSTPTGQGTARTQSQRSGFDATQQNSMLADINSRVDTLKADLNKLDSCLTKAQVRYLDNFDFDGSQYGLRTGSQTSGSGASGFDRSTWQGNSNGTRPDDATLQRMQEQMQKQRREQQERLVNLYKQVYDFLKQRVR